MPSGLVSVPLPFGMWTRRTGGARYVPDFARSSSDRRLSSRFAWYSCALCPSTPRAPSLRVRRYASRSQSMSMRWARLRNAMSGASLASFATRSSFVETSTEVCGSAIFPSNSSMTRCRPLLGGVPRVGSPASSLLLRHSDSPRPRSARLRFARRFHLPVEATGPPRFLGDPRVHAPLSDPGGTAASGHSGRALPSGRCDGAFRCSNGVGSHELTDFGAVSRGLHARCLRFATTVTRVLPTAAQDSLPAGGPPWPDRT